MDLTSRIDEPELMDTRIYPVDVMKETLAFLEVTNRFFGGVAVFVRHFEAWSARWRPGERIDVLDVGAGSADIAKALVMWARKKKIDLRVKAIDLVPEVVSVAREKTRGIPEISIERADVFQLPDAPGSFDYVISSLLLHHIRPSESVCLLKKFDALSSRGIVASDLLRSRSSYWAVKSLSRLIGNDIVRHDGPLSVRRAFQPDELSRMAAEAGLGYFVARREPWFRVSLAGEKN